MEWQWPTFRLPVQGWRRAAAVNTVLVLIASVVLLIVLGCSVAGAGSVANSLTIYTGACDVSGRINLFLHLLLNIVSTCIIASSNFFMQVLNAPTREEVDAAHAKRRSLEIGVPSFRNILHVARFKTILWVLFACSSVPIHLLFNSAFFETDYQGSEFYMTMATEAFVNGTKYYGPGASLVNPGAEYNIYDPSPAPCDVNSGWGCYSNLTTFIHGSSPILQNLSRTAATVQSWTRLDAHGCQAQYGTCAPRRQYGDVVLIVDGQLRNMVREAPADRAGFLVGDLFNITQSGVPYNPSNFSTEQLQTYWSQFGPLGYPNPLWFSAQCFIKVSTDHPALCDHSCGASLGLSTDLIDATVLASTIDSGKPWEIPLFYYSAGPPRDNGYSGSNVTIAGRPIFNTTTIDANTSLEITHCYAQPLPNSCKIGMSNALLLAVTISVITKAILCTIVTTKVPGEPLVTPGDAVVSFITRPDSTTDCRATLSTADCRNKGRPDDANWSGIPPGPREWRQAHPRRRAAGIGNAAWIRAYGLIILALIGTAILLAQAAYESPIRGGSDAFGHDLDNGTLPSGMAAVLGFTASILMANVPQQVLALCYFAYNALITRLCAEMEWNLYAVSHRPLRVSNPVGGQVATYRLQLPYRYSLPLLITSILLHWLVSNTLYIFIIDGGYVADSMVISGISNDAFVGIGFSSLAILLVFLISIVLIIIPVRLAFARLRGNMVLCGSNSVIISAACHVSTLEGGGASGFGKMEPTLPPAGSSSTIELQPLMSSPRQAPQEQDKIGAAWSLDDLYKARSLRSVNLRRSSRDEGLARLWVGRQPVRWGVVRMPQEWYARFQDFGSELGHLAFGTIDHWEGEPQIGKFYG